MLYGRSFQIWNTKKRHCSVRSYFSFTLANMKHQTPTLPLQEKRQQQKLMSKRKETHKPFHWFAGIHTDKSTALFVIFN